MSEPEPSLAHPVDPAIKNAERSLAARLGMSEQCVTIRIGDRDEDDRSIGMVSAREDENTNLVMTFHRNGATLNRDAKEDELRKKLAADSATASIAQWEKTEKLAPQLKDNIKSATAGTDFDEKLLDWRPFNKDVIKMGRNFADYAIEYVNDTAYGLDLNVVIPRGEDENWKDNNEKTAKKLEARLEEMRRIIQDRVIERNDPSKDSYYKTNLQKEGKSDEEIAAIIAKAKEDMAKLQISITTDDYAGIRISIRTPEQAEAYKKAANKYDTPDNADALKANNPLQHVVTRQVTKDNPHPQLHKALARALLYTEDKKRTDYFTDIAGAHDMKVAIAKEFRRIEKDNPDKAAAFKEILESPLFKDHGNWLNGLGQAGNALPEPSITQPLSKPDIFVVKLPIKRSQVAEFIAKLNEAPAVAAAPAAVPPAAPAPDTLSFTQQTSAVSALAAASTAISAAGSELEKLANEIIGRLPSWEERQKIRDTDREKGAGYSRAG